VIQPPTEEGQLRKIAEGEELVVHRILVSADLASAELLDSLRSNADLERPPRAKELTHPLIHSGITTWLQPEQAVANAKTFPRLGDFVAVVRLDAASGARHFEWGRPGHLTVWADPLMILERIEDIFAL
jgi:hypothetical protein